MLAVLVFGFYWRFVCAHCRCIAKWASGRGKKSRTQQLAAASGDDYRGVYYRLLLLALTLFVGQVLSDNLNGAVAPSLSNKVCFSTPLP